MSRTPQDGRALSLVTDGITYVEFAQAGGWSEFTARNWLGKLVRRGLIWRLDRSSTPAAYYLSEKALEQAKEARRGMTAARRRFNDANGVPNACMPPTFTAPTHCAFNPDVRRMSFKAQWDAAEPHIPPGVTVQRLPGFERFGSPQAAKMARG